MIGQIQNPQLEAGGPTSHWIGPEMLIELTVEGRNFSALADSGSQVNTITPTLVQQCKVLISIYVGFLPISSRVVHKYI